MTFKTLKTNFERELLFQIIQNLRKDKLSHVQAQILAQNFLPILRSESSEEFIEKLSKLGQFHPEILEAFVITIKEYEIESQDERLKNAREKIKQITTN